jgi:CheY-like chemotaxis protein
MKHENVLKDFSALSFEVGHVTADRRPAIADSQPRLTPVSVRDFNVQSYGSENQDSPENDGLATTRYWPQKVLLLFSNDPGFQVSVRQVLPQQVELMPVRDAEQATRLAHKSYIDAALLDLDLEDCNGWRTAERLLADDMTIRLLLAAETNGRADLVAGVSAEVLLKKPVNAAQIVERLNCLLRQSKHERFRLNLSLHNFLRYAQPLPSSRINPVSGLNE